MKSPTRPKFKFPVSGIFAAGVSLGHVHLAPLAEASERPPIREVEDLAPTTNSREGYHYGTETIELPMLTRNLGDLDPGWSDQDDAEFDALCRKFVLDQIEPEERARYENLKALRRQAKAGRSYEEIRRDMKLHDALEKAIDALEMIRSL